MKKEKAHSFEISNLSLLNIIGLSLLLTSSYYFVEFSTFISVDFATQFVELSFLFIFSVIFFLLLVIFFKLLEKKLPLAFSSFLTYIFFTWVLVQSIQTFFYLSNYITLSYFISKVFFLYPYPEYEVYIRAIRFILPYAICFLIIYFFKNNLLKFLRFFTILGFIFVFISIFREMSFVYSIFDTTSSTLKLEYEVEVNNKIDKKRKVLWVVFDEFDPQIAFEKDKFLDNFENLKNNSVFHSQMYMPAKQTVVSLPAQLMGVDTKGLEIKNRIYYLKDRKKNLLHLKYDNTIFGRLDKLGLKSNIFSSVIPYCSAHLKFHRLENCKEKYVKPPSVSDVLKRPLNENLRGIFFVFSPILKIKYFFSLLKGEGKDDFVSYQTQLNDKNIEKEIEEVKKLDTNKQFKNIEDLDGYNVIKYSDIKNFLAGESNLGFFHAYLPHLDADYSSKIFDKKVNGILSSYILNLKLTDIVIKKIMNISKHYKDEEIMLIFSSDHWFRLKDPIEKNFYPSLFIAKILTDNSKIEISEKDSGIYIQELIYKFFIKNINNHEDIKLFFENKPYHRPCLTDECLIGKKRLRI